jgi:predicted ester cyclase
MGIASTLGDVSGAIGVGDWGRLTELLSSRFFDHAPVDDEPSASDRLVAFLRDIRAAIPDLEVLFDDVADGPDEATATLAITGTHDHALWGSPGTGRRVEWANPVTVRAYDDGLAVRFDDADFPSLLSALRQIGLVNPPDRMDEPPPYPVSAPEFLLKVVMTGQAGDKECSHLDGIRVTEPSTRVCAQCFAEGTNWPALRMCLTCGFVGCCDTSKNKHMQQHVQETGHPMMRSIRLDEGWVWCYPDAAFFESSILDAHRPG